MQKSELVSTRINHPDVLRSVNKSLKKVVKLLFAGYQGFLSWPDRKPHGETAAAWTVSLKTARRDIAKAGLIS